MNYEAKIITENESIKIGSNEYHSCAELYKRKKGDIVQIHIDSKGNVLVYSDGNKKQNLAIVIGLFNDIESAKVYLTCVRKITTDVNQLYNKALDERYW